MRKIGVIGGMSWQSTAQTYRLLNELVSSRLGARHSARCVIASVDFEQVVTMQRAGDWEAAGELLASEARRLEAAGAECVFLATNTMHLVAPAIEAALTVPFLHVVDVVAARVEARGFGTIGLLGTRYTMRERFYVEALAERGITALVPDSDEEIDELDRIIFDEIAHGRVLDASRQVYCTAMSNMLERGAQAIVLGCTEIMLLVGACDCSAPIIDTTEAQARAAVDFALA